MKWDPRWSWIAMMIAVLTLTSAVAFAGVSGMVPPSDQQDAQAAAAASFAHRNGIKAVHSLLGSLSANGDNVDWHQLGLSESEIPNLTVGDGFHVHTLDIAGIKRGRLLSEVLMPTPKWYFTVKSGNRTVGFMMLDSQGGEFRFTGFAAMPYDPLASLDQARAELAKQGRTVKRAIYVEADDQPYFNIEDDAMANWLVPVQTTVSDLSPYEASRILGEIQSSLN